MCRRGMAWRRHCPRRRRSPVRSSLSSGRIATMCSMRSFKRWADRDRKSFAATLKRGNVSTAWLALLLAGLLEIGWALGLKYSDGLTRFWPSVATVIAVIFSFVLLGMSLKSVPVGTAYALWTGIGAAGTAIIGMVAFGESADIFRVACLSLIVAGMV